MNTDAKNTLLIVIMNVLSMYGCDACLIRGELSEATKILPMMLRNICWLMVYRSISKISRICFRCCHLERHLHYKKITNELVSEPLNSWTVGSLTNKDVTQFFTIVWNSVNTNFSTGVHNLYTVYSAFKISQVYFELLRLKIRQWTLLINL